MLKFELLCLGFLFSPGTLDLQGRGLMGIIALSPSHMQSCHPGASLAGTDPGFFVPCLRDPRRPTRPELTESADSLGLEPERYMQVSL